ncbi:hypothetical protein [Glutamicibacter sp. PS]|uniref:hypothetical protein n=1 Tax=Glutamicibacter sp. PS TaxID=3075634 RepID=UPI00284AC034|nr:hypothetical protein [Glutamicibacter sp. PS]MDR4533982.1 hypothetical protein [Glutamicibacter sp. PS]
MATLLSMGIRSSNLPAIEQATRRNWESWCELLEHHGAADLPHAQIADHAVEHMPDDLANPGWWAQSVAVAYEQHIGRRLPGQAADGSFQGSVSKTLEADLDYALDLWRAQVATLSTFNGASLLGKPTESGSENWRYWRAAFSDGSRVSVDIGQKGNKTSLSVNQRKIREPENLASWKDFWKQVLGSLDS